MGLPKQVSGSSYANEYERLVHAASTANGEVVIDEPLPEPLVGSSVPQLSNGEAAAVMQAWRRAAQRSSVAWSLWYELTIYALGWRAEGDRFDMSKKHAREPYPADMLPLVWAWTARLAEDLDAHHTVVRPLYIDTSWSGYEMAARLAWEQMEEDRAPAAPAAPSEAVISPGNVTGEGSIVPAVSIAPVQDKPSSGFPWWLLVVGAVVIGGRKKR